MTAEPGRRFLRKQADQNEKVYEQRLIGDRYQPPRVFEGRGDDRSFSRDSE